MARIPAAQRRNDFIRAAIEVIAQHGVEGATTRRIAEQAGANLAMLHYCYDSKESLFSDVYAHVAGRYRAVLNALGPHSTLNEAAREALLAVGEFYLASPEFAAAAFELINWGRRQEEDRGVAVYDDAFATLRATLLSAPSEPPASPELIDEIGYIAVTLADGFGVNWLTHGDRAKAQQQLEMCVAALDCWLTARLGQLAASH